VPAALIKISVGVCIIEEPQEESLSFPAPSLKHWSPNMHLHYSVTPLSSRTQTVACHLIQQCPALFLLKKNKLKTLSGSRQFPPSVKHSIENALIDRSPHELTITEVPQQGTSPTRSDLHSFKVSKFRFTPF